MKELLPYIVERIERSKARYGVHSFDSGVLMIDIFIGDRFCVIQVYGDEIGLSRNTEDPLR